MTPPHLDALRSTFTGEIILPTDSQYEQASKTFIHQGSPAIVLKPRNVEDVRTAIAYTRDNSLILSVRSGGHSGPGFSTNDDGVVIDLSLLKKVALIDADRHIVKVEGGALWIEVATFLKEHGLAISSGDTKTVGVGGLTLGGGIGWLVRKVGLAIDSLVAAEIVTANGEVLRASAEENPDLFWALRGGGGNFGVTTAFEFAAHPQSKVYAGTIQYGLEDLAGLLTGWRDAMRKAPEDLTTMLLVMPTMGENPPMAMVMCCYANDNEAQATSALKPLRQLGQVKNDTITLKNYADVLEDAHPPAGVHIIAQNVFLPKVSGEVIKAITELYAKVPHPPILQIRSLGGAMKRVDKDATAFAHREAEALLVGAMFLPLDAPSADVEQAMNNWQTLATFGSGNYANLLSTSSEELVKAAYPPATYERLAKVKRQYDPENLFNQNFNIKPE